jgi:hypothetical protein
MIWQWSIHDFYTLFIEISRQALIIQLEKNMTVARHQGMKASYKYLENGIMGYCVGFLKASGAMDIECRQIVSCTEGKGYSQLEYTWR